MKYTLDTETHFLVALGRWKEEETQSMKDLGFSQEQLDNSSEVEIEEELQKMHKDWEQNYLDSGWTIVE